MFLLFYVAVVHNEVKVLRVTWNAVIRVNWTDSTLAAAGLECCMLVNIEDGGNCTSIIPSLFLWFLFCLFYYLALHIVSVF